MDLDDIKRNVDLREFAHTRYDIDCNPKGLASCPFHPPDNHPSFSIFIGDDDFWRWKDHNDGSTGTIIDLVARIENIGEEDAIQKLLKEFNPMNANHGTDDIEREHIYRHTDNSEVFKKVKRRNPSNPKYYFIQHKTNGGWKLGKGIHEWIPYNLDRFKDHKKAIVCEGEKDADTVMTLGLDYVATSAPTGKGSWPDCLTKYFRDLEEITFIYDVGNEEDAKKHSQKILTELPEKMIYIARVPLERREADITDYLDKFEAKTERINKFHAIINERELVESEPLYDECLPVESINTLLSTPLPEIERLVDPFVERNCLTMIGGVKGAGKSLFVTNLALHFASGKSGFLNSKIEKAGRVLYIQQEINIAGLQKRLEKMMMEEVFFLQDKFSHVTTTGNPLKLTSGEDFDKIRRTVDVHSPDILILDPFSTFNATEENNFRDMSKIVDRLNQLKTEFHIGLILTHHFSSKKNPDDPHAPIEVSGLFRGHTTLSDSADALIGLTRLPSHQKNQVLPLRYDHYLMIEVMLRNGEAPEKYAIEREEDSLIFRTSDILIDIGKKILPGEIRDLIEANGGEILQRDVLEFLKDRASFNTIRKAIDEDVKRKILKKVTEPGKHGMKKLVLMR